MRVLDIGGRVEDLSRATLRRQYHRQARACHPDKSSAADATAQFQRLSAALDVLETCIGERRGAPSYTVELGAHLRTALSSEVSDVDRAAALRAIFDSLVSHCGVRADRLFGEMDYAALRAMLAVLEHARRAAGLPETVLARVRAIVEARRPAPIRVALRPSLEDLFSQNVFVLREGDATFVVPLWASEVVFEDPLTGADVEVSCAPALPRGATIDERNNITVATEFDVRDLWGREEVHVHVGGRRFVLRVADLRLAPSQTVELSPRGAPAFNADDIYSVAELAGVFAHVRLFLRAGPGSQTIDHYFCESGPHTDSLADTPQHPAQ